MHTKRRILTTIVSISIIALVMILGLIIVRFKSFVQQATIEKDLLLVTAVANYINEEVSEGTYVRNEVEEALYGTGIEFVVEEDWTKGIGEGIECGKAFVNDRGSIQWFDLLNIDGKIYLIRLWMHLDIIDYDNIINYILRQSLEKDLRNVIIM